jgi:Arc/MetJ-type ribon-helix-helix transcriptional regulator
MSKITFRADDELIEELETFDASKSEVMREALRQYLGQQADADVETAGDDAATTESDRETIDDLIEGRIDDLVAERIDELVDARLESAAVGRRRPQDVNVNITLDGDAANATDDDGSERKTPTADRDEESERSQTTCPQCGEDVGEDHVYCPNCGEKTSRRVFCECGDELRSDWAFCPSCGRRTPAADVLDSK